MMNYKEFKESLVNEVEQILKDKAIVKVQLMKKVNQNNREGLQIAEVGKNIAPVLYLDELYQKYVEGEKFEEIVAIIVNEYQKSPVIDGIELLMNWEKAKSQIRLELINQEWNEALLEDMPYEKMEDLAGVCRVELFHNEEGCAGCLVKKGLLDYWNITEEELFQVAHENLKQEAFYIKDLKTVIAETLGRDITMEIEIEDDTPKQYVLTNTRKMNGAVGLLRKELLKEFSDTINRNLYILPSSIHELILIPDDTQLNGEELQKMVLQVNHECVEQEERLSDHVYYYDKEQDMIQVVA